MSGVTPIVSVTRGTLPCPPVTLVTLWARDVSDKSHSCHACPADEGQKGHAGQLSLLSRLSRTYPNIENEGVIAMSIKHAGQDVARENQAARDTLATLKPFGTWLDEKDRTPCETRIALNVVREIIALANLSPAEHAATAKKLELDAATSAQDKRDVH